jgi:rSAM/selenodomain-associated transferase 1
MASQQARARGAVFVPRLIIMAKSPVAGVAKRRLGREIGDCAAMRFYRNCLMHTVLRLARGSRWQTMLAVAPDKDVAQRYWPSPCRMRRLPQGHGDLGARMQRLFKCLPPGPAIIIGSDIPEINASHIAQAFELLGRADAVLGPASDGGYWLVGLKRSPRTLAPFAGVRWSGPHALADTLANLKRKRVAFAPTLDDVDTAQSYSATKTLTERLVAPRQPPKVHQARV